MEIISISHQTREAVWRDDIYPLSEHIQVNICEPDCVCEKKVLDKGIYKQHL